MCCVASRLFELVAEEIAIEDTIYLLGKALSQDKVELNAYMKVSFFLYKELPIVLLRV